MRYQRLRYSSRPTTYLGHAHVTDTYWDLTETPELLQCALLRVEPSERGDRDEERQHISHTAGEVLHGPAHATVTGESSHACELF